MLTRALDETKKLCDLEAQLRSMMNALQKLNRLSRTDAHTLNNVLTVVVAYEDLRDEELVNQPMLLEEIHRAELRASEALRRFAVDPLIPPAPL